MTEQPPLPEPAPPPSNGSWMRRSMTFRVLMIGLLGLLMLIPLAMVEGLIHEREMRKHEAQEEVSSTWGGPQVLAGPVISVPYEAVARVDANDGSGRYEMRTVRQYAHFLPDELVSNTVVEPERRHRGIYDVVVYKARVGLSGKFKALENNELGMNERLLWDAATVTFGVSDLRSIREQVRMRMGDRELSFKPGAPVNDLVGTAISAPLSLDPEDLDREWPFSLELQMNGSSHLRMVPVGRVTKATMASAWQDPSFQGSFLPDSSRIGADGFEARWTVLHLNRPYPQEFLGNKAWQLEQSAFGVDLVLPVDEYRKSTRAAKYGSMLIALVFLVFFFTEVLQRLRIHPIQYLLVGLALCIFYTLLIALGEHMGFGRAYAISAVAVIGLVVFYASAVFRLPRATRLLSMVLVLVYGFVFTIIHQEDYALLMGSIGLFVVLAVVMALSRRIDWYNARNSED